MSSLATTARLYVAGGKKDLVFVPTIAVLSSFALAPTSTIAPTTLFLAALHTYSRILFPSLTYARFGALLLGLSIGGAAPNISASLDALSSTPQAIFFLTLLSSFISAIVLAAVYTDWLLSRHITSSLGKRLLFPAIWATTWSTIPYISPVGHLLGWTRGNVLDAYRWLVPIMGTSSQDWIAAAGAVVLSEVYQEWYMGTSDEDEDEEQSRERKKARSPTPFIAAFLGLLIVPSYFTHDVLPLPVSNADEATAFGVGCIMPSFQRYKHYEPTLKDYIDETKKFQNSAKFLLWPEGAVSFDSDKERDAAFEEVRLNISGSYVGVSFEQHVPDPSDPTGRRSVRKTGIAVISQASEKPHLVYFKRHLVPVVESYQLAHSLEPPALVDVTIPRPRDVPPSKWGPKGLRNVSVTASICLDFAHPLPFGHIDSRPGLVFGPARTWERSVGISMWLQAQQRAAELDTAILWCDGGDGGVSGIAGGGYESFEQVGRGSWVKSIGLDHPFDQSQTFYARWGDLTLLVYWISIVSPSLLGVVLAGSTKHALPVVGGLRRLVLGLRRRTPERQPLLGENVPPLIDF